MSDGTCNHCGKITPTYRKRVGDDVQDVHAASCSQRCRVRRWRDQYREDYGISYDTERGLDLKRDAK